MQNSAVDALSYLQKVAESELDFPDLIFLDMDMDLPALLSSYPPAHFLASSGKCFMYLRLLHSLS